MSDGGVFNMCYWAVRANLPKTRQEVDGDMFSVILYDKNVISSVQRVVKTFPFSDSDLSAI